MAKLPHILVIGSINMDLVTQVDHLPEPGQTVLAGDLAMIPGGKGANQAVAAARLGAIVTFAARVGDDAWGRTLVDSLADNGVHTDHIRIDPDHATGAAMIFIDREGENRIIVAPGANTDLTVDDVDRAFDIHRHSPIDGVLLQLETSFATARRAIDLANVRDIPVILDAGPAQPVPLDQMHGLTVLSPNESEAQSLTGMAIESMDDAAQAARFLQEKTGARDVVMKLGDQGALIQTAAGSRLIPPFKVQPIDTTAAGDSFTAALTLRLCLGDPLPQAVQYANAAGALAVTTKGAQPSLPTAEAVASLLEHGELVENLQ